MTETTNTESKRLQAEAAESRRKEAESFDRCDTDGFLSQWAHGITARLADARADIIEAGGVARFTGLYQGTRRVKARIIATHFGYSWLLHEDEQELWAARGKPFLPVGKRSRVLKAHGLAEKPEMAPADARISGSGKGLSGCTGAVISTFRTGCRWGSDAVMVTE